MLRCLCLCTFVLALASGCAVTSSRPTEMGPPEDELARQLHAEIWFELRSNALIGNGNWLISRWVNAGSEQDDPPQLHIQNLLCSGRGNLLRCQFGLLRDGGVTDYLGEPTPDELDCTANFRRLHGAWSIPRLPPRPEGGHSRITIDCQTLG